jgi:hypothetical protein
VGKIFLIAEKDKDSTSPVGIPAGELVLIKGQGHVRLSFPENLLGKSGYAVAQLIAFVVRFDDGRLLAASFAGENGEEAACGEFQVWEPVEATEFDFPETPAMQEESVISSDEPPEPAAESVNPAQISIRRIALYDLFSLPGSNRQLCKNSFLVHGFFNYRYLIEKNITQDGQTCRYIGVPGVYSPQEQKFAEMYGFPDFEQAEPQNYGEDDAKKFGYWIRPL